MADWISEKSKPNSIIHVDLEVTRFKPLAELFTISTRYRDCEFKLYLYIGINCVSWN